MDLQLRPELPLFAIHLGDENLTGAELLVHLHDGQLSHLGQPSGDLVPHHAAEKDEVSGKIVGLYAWRSPPVHGGTGILRPYVPVQLDQGVDVGVCLQFCVVKVGGIPELPSHILRELCADEGYRTRVREVPRSAERRLCLRRTPAGAAPERHQLRLECLVGPCLVRSELVKWQQPWLPCDRALRREETCIGLEPMRGRELW